MFDGDDLKRFIDQATYITVNDYEWQLMTDRTGWDYDEVKSRVEALIVTRGGEIHPAKGKSVSRLQNRRRSRIPPVAVMPIVPACCTACRTTWTGRPPAASLH